MKQRLLQVNQLKKEGKRSENRVPLPDFLIGAHAKAEGMKLVTRDPDRVRTYFPDVQLVISIATLMNNQPEGRKSAGQMLLAHSQL